MYSLILLLILSSLFLFFSFRSLLLFSFIFSLLTFCAFLLHFIQLSTFPFFPLVSLSYLSSYIVPSLLHSLLFFHCYPLCFSLLRLPLTNHLPLLLSKLPFLPSFLPSAFPFRFSSADSKPNHQGKGAHAWLTVLIRNAILSPFKLLGSVVMMEWLACATVYPSYSHPGLDSWLYMDQLVFDRPC